MIHNQKMAIIGDTQYTIGNAKDHAVLRVGQRKNANAFEHCEHIYLIANNSSRFALEKYKMSDPTSGYRYTSLEVYDIAAMDEYLYVTCRHHDNVYVLMIDMDLNVEQAFDCRIPASISIIADAVLHISDAIHVVIVPKYSMSNETVTVRLSLDGEFEWMRPESDLKVISAEDKLLCVGYVDNNALLIERSHESGKVLHSRIYEVPGYITRFTHGFVTDDVTMVLGNMVDVHLNDAVFIRCYSSAMNYLGGVEIPNRTRVVQARLANNTLYVIVVKESNASVEHDMYWLYTFDSHLRKRGEKILRQPTYDFVIHEGRFLPMLNDIDKGAIIHELRNAFRENRISTEWLQTFSTAVKNVMHTH